MTAVSEINSCLTFVPCFILFISAGPKTTPWSSWSACDLPCGGGIQYQRRFVIEDDVLSTGKIHMPGTLEYRLCNMHACGKKPPCLRHNILLDPKGQFDMADSIAFDFAAENVEACQERCRLYGIDCGAVSFNTLTNACVLKSRYCSHEDNMWEFSDSGLPTRSYCKCQTGGILNGSPEIEFNPYYIAAPSSCDETLIM